MAHRLQDSNPRACPTASRLRILLVDDSQLVIERLREMLGPLPGFEIAGQAISVREALRLFPRVKPDVLLLDLHMADGSGLEVLEKVKRRKPPPFVVVLTNTTFRRSRQKCLDAGADFCFDKSAEFKKIPGVLRGLMRTSPRSGSRPSFSRARPLRKA